MPDRPNCSAYSTFARLQHDQTRNTNIRFDMKDNKDGIRNHTRNTIGTGHVISPETKDRSNGTRNSHPRCMAEKKLRRISPSTD